MVPSWNYIDTDLFRLHPLLCDEQFMVGFANSGAALLIISASAFPTESSEIERTANGVRFPWTIPNSAAYTPLSKCLSDLGSQNAKRFCAQGCRQNFVGSQSKFARLCPGTLPVSCA
jgi:hypothetical protein